MQKRQSVSPAQKKDYRCISFYKNDSEQSVRTNLVQVWGKYIAQQEESKGL